MRLWLPDYESWDQRIRRKIPLPPEIRAKQVRISPATIDCLLGADEVQAISFDVTVGA